MDGGQHFNPDDLDEEEKRLFDEMVREEMEKLENQFRSALPPADEYEKVQYGNTGAKERDYAERNNNDYSREPVNEQRGYNGRLRSPPKISRPQRMEPPQQSVGNGRLRLDELDVQDSSSLGRDDSVLLDRAAPQASMQPEMSQMGNRRYRQVSHPVEYLDSRPGNSISDIGASDNAMSPVQKRAQQAAYSKQIADSTLNSPVDSSRPSRRKPSADVSIDADNALSAIGQSSDRMKDDKRRKQLEYAQQLQRQQQQNEEYAVKPVERVSRRASSGVGGRGDESDWPPRKTLGSSASSASGYPDHSGSSSRGTMEASPSGKLANFGADPNAEAIKKREMKLLYARQLQEQQYHNQHAKEEEAQKVSSRSPKARETDRERDRGYGGERGYGVEREYSYPDIGAGQKGRGSSYSASFSEGQSDGSYVNYGNYGSYGGSVGSAPSGIASIGTGRGADSNDQAAREQKRLQQKQYYDEITRAAAAAPISLERAPLRRGTPTRRQAEPENSWGGNGTGLQIGGDAGRSSARGGSSYPAQQSDADAVRMEDKMRKLQQQQMYAKQLAEDHSQGEAAKGIAETQNSRSRAALNPPRSDSRGRGYYGQELSSGGPSGGLFGATEDAATAAAKKKATQQEYYRQLKEEEDYRERMNAQGDTGRVSLYRKQQQQKMNEENAMGGNTVRGSTPQRRQAPGYEEDRAAAQYAQRRDEEIQMKLAASKRKQQEDFRKALQEDASAAPIQNSYTPMKAPHHQRYRDIDERDYPYRNHESPRSKALSGRPDAGAGPGAGPGAGYGTDDAYSRGGGAGGPQQAPYIASSPAKAYTQQFLFGADARYGQSAGPGPGLGPPSDYRDSYGGQGAQPRGAGPGGSYNTPGDRMPGAGPSGPSGYSAGPSGPPGRNAGYGAYPNYGGQGGQGLQGGPDYRDRGTSSGGGQSSLSLGGSGYGRY